MSTIYEELSQARLVGAPLIAVATPDQPAVQRELKDGAAGKADDGGDEAFPLLAWDAARGPYGINKKGGAALNDILKGGDPLKFAQLPDMLIAAADLAEDSVLLLHNGHRCFGPDLARPQLLPIQCMMNLRDRFKANNRALVLLGPSFADLPAELATDVLVLDDPYPDERKIETITTTFWNKNNVKYSADELSQSKQALRGLPAFPVEQAAALSVVKEKGVYKLDFEKMWRRKKQAVETTPGMTFSRPTLKHADLGGLDALKAYCAELGDGPEPPLCVVHIDEIEKLTAGAAEGGAGDNTGASQDQIKTLLTEMERNKWIGDLRVGGPGGGKSFSAEVFAGELGVPLLEWDLGAVKSSLLGSSEARIRAGIKMLFAIAGMRGAYFIGTCNQLDTLPPALQRRFNFATWYFDLPTADQRVAIGAIHTAKYPAALKRDDAFWRKCDGWSPANIRDCCRLAYALRRTLTEAARSVVPAARRDAEGIARLRLTANGRFLDASKPGIYTTPQPQIEEAKTTIRKIGELFEVSPPALGGTPTAEERKKGN
jgi:hypothetical protein